MSPGHCCVALGAQFLLSRELISKEPLNLILVCCSCLGKLTAQLVGCFRQIGLHGAQSAEVLISGSKKGGLLAELTLQFGHPSRQCVDVWQISGSSWKQEKNQC